MHLQEGSKLLCRVAVLWKVELSVTGALWEAVAFQSWEDGNWPLSFEKGF